MMSNSVSARCARNSSPTRSWKTTRSNSTRLLALLAAVLVTSPLLAEPRPLQKASSRDRRIEQRWQLDGTPRGVAVGPDGTIYVGLADRQSLLAIDPSTGTLLSETVLDDPDIAATKELVSIRLDNDGRRLLIANGSDESVSIVSIPDLQVIREIGLEGEVVRDVIADPAGRYLYVLGRNVHVYDYEGQRKIRELRDLGAMAIATDPKGSRLHVVGSESVQGTTVTSVATYDTARFDPPVIEPLQTDRTIRAARVSAGGAALVVVADDWFGEKSLAPRAAPTMQTTGDTMRLNLGFGDLVSGQSICLSTDLSPQILERGIDGDVVYFGERPCSKAGSMTGSARRVAIGSVYGIEAAAIALDPARRLLYVTEPSGYLGVWKLPKAERPGR